MKNWLIWMSLLLIVGFSACKKDDKKSAKLSVRLTDAPAAYQEVNVEILKVRVNITDNNGSSTWSDLQTNAGVYNLLQLQNGIDTTLADFSVVPAGTLTQMRLMLGTNNTVMADSVIHPLSTPSGRESGVKLNGNVLIDPNQPLVVLIDFDAMESVVETGNGKYQLKPVIKMLP